jgi:hypothetical protein
MIHVWCMMYDPGYSIYPTFLSQLHKCYSRGPQHPNARKDPATHHSAQSHPPSWLQSAEHPEWHHASAGAPLSLLTSASPGLLATSWSVAFEEEVGAGFQGGEGDAKSLSADGKEQWAEMPTSISWQLRRRARRSGSVKPVALPQASKKLQPGDLCTVAGWGRVSQSRGTNVLQEVQLRVQMDQMCANRFQFYNSQTQICVGNPRERKSAFRVRMWTPTSVSWDKV